jgi:ABC-2 type transport system ATP-binding protein
MDLLSIHNLAKSYPKKKLFDQLHLQVETGQIIGLVGENGAGKSTLLSILASLITPDSGTVTFNGISYSERNKIRKEIGYVPQELSLWENLTVEENMLYFSKLSWGNISLQQCQQLCQQMQLTQWKEKCANLSGGMKRKLNIAISLIHNPNLILLDEPTVGIDMRSKEEIGLYLKRLAKEQQKTIIYTSHDMNEIESYCDHVYIIGQDPFYYDFLAARGVQVTRLQ